MAKYVRIVDGGINFLLQVVDATQEAFGGYALPSGEFTQTLIPLRSAMRFNTAQEASQWAKRQGWIVHEGIYNFGGNREK